MSVGSANPEKVEAVRLAFAPHYPSATVRAVRLPSPVSAQPLGDAETRRGAVLRARKALGHTDDSTFGVGIESGVDLYAAGGPVVVSWCAIVHRDGRERSGPGQPVPLPPMLADALASGTELREALSLLPARRHGGTAHGLIGVLTDGALTRRELTRALVATSLAPFLHPAWFGRLRDDEPGSQRAD